MLGIDSVKSGINSERLAMTSRTVSRYLTAVLDVEHPEARGESGGCRGTPVTIGTIKLIEETVTRMRRAGESRIA